MPLHVTARAPTRVDVLGGTLDLAPLHHLLEAKATINVAVSLYAQATVEVIAGAVFHIQSQDQGIEISGSYPAVSRDPRLALVSLCLQSFWQADLPALRIILKAQSPAGAGLGGSSSLALCLTAALRQARALVSSGSAAVSLHLSERDERALVQTVQDLESRLIASPAGCQDHWGAMRGGVNLLTYPFGGVQVETWAPAELPACQEGLILCYSGKSRFSGMNNWELYKRFFDGDREIQRQFAAIGDLAAAAGEALRRRDWEQVLELSVREWAVRKTLCPSIETPETQALTAAALKAGARCARVCGAGGGGVLLVYAPAARKEAVEAALQAAGGSLLPANVSAQGLQVSVQDEKATTRG